MIGTAKEVFNQYKETKRKALNTELDEWIVEEAQDEKRRAYIINKAKVGIEQIKRQTDQLQYDWKKDTEMLKGLVVKWTDLTMSSAPKSAAEAIKLILDELVSSIDVGRDKRGHNRHDIVEGVGNLIEFGELVFFNMVQAMDRDSKNRWSIAFEVKIEEYITESIRDLIYILRVNAMES